MRSACRQSVLHFDCPFPFNFPVEAGGCLRQLSAVFLWLFFVFGFSSSGLKSALFKDGFENPSRELSLYNVRKNGQTGLCVFVRFL